MKVTRLVGSFRDSRGFVGSSCVWELPNFYFKTCPFSMSVIAGGHKRSEILPRTTESKWIKKGHINDWNIKMSCVSVKFEFYRRRSPITVVRAHTQGWRDIVILVDGWRHTFRVTPFSYVKTGWVQPADIRNGGTGLRNSRWPTKKVQSEKGDDIFIVQCQPWTRKSDPGSHVSVFLVPRSVRCQWFNLELTVPLYTVSSRLNVKVQGKMFCHFDIR